MHTHTHTHTQSPSVYEGAQARVAGVNVSHPIRNQIVQVDVLLHASHGSLFVELTDPQKLEQVLGVCGQQTSHHSQLMQKRVQLYASFRPRLCVKSG